MAVLAPHLKQIWSYVCLRAGAGHTLMSPAAGNRGCLWQPLAPVNVCLGIPNHFNLPSTSKRGFGSSSQRLPPGPLHGSLGLLMRSSSATSSAVTDQALQQEQQQQPRGPSQPSRQARSKQQQPQQEQQGAMLDIVKRNAVLFIGFHPEEMDIVRQHLPALLGEGSAADNAGCGSDVDARTTLVDVTQSMLPYTVGEVLLARNGSVDGDGPHHVAVASGGTAAVSAGRVVLLVGRTAQGLGGQLNDLLAEWGVVPALIAAFQPQHVHLSLNRLVSFLRDAHARYYRLLQPVRVDPLLPLASGSMRLGEHEGSHSEVGEGDGGRHAERPSAADGGASTVGTEGCEAVAAAVVAADHLAVLEDVRVVLSAALDAGEVPSIQGHYRPDSGHLVVLDGLITETERGQLLDWLIAPGHQHEGPPPVDKWEVACVDREGDQATWGLQPQVLAALRDDPPPPVVALQTRLAALYPEYDICHMPADQISDDVTAGGDEGDDVTPLSSFVGNAVMPGDPCAWHVDADPTTVPAHSPWVHNFGYYHNREPGRPLFVSVLLYLNSSWGEDYHAETLFLDPQTQLGLFVRPSPGRVVLLDQDVPHRISAPSREALGPRYSLVWKLVLVPKEDHGQQEKEEEEEEGGRPGGGSGEAAAFQSICRPEWGEPIRIGSASGRCGVRAFQRGRGAGR